MGRGDQIFRDRAMLNRADAVLVRPQVPEGPF
jgi:hypothetical protein